jgi:hypothetical protein
MKVYVFGNKDVPDDENAIEVAERLEYAIEGVSFVFVGPNEDTPFVGERHAVILDTVRGIRDVALIEGDEIDRTWSTSCEMYMRRTRLWRWPAA